MNINCPANAEITVFSANGIQLQKTFSLSTITKLNVSGLSTGVYFIKIKTQTQQQTLRFIKK